MSVREEHTFMGEPGEVGGGDPGIGVIRLGVAVAHVVGEDDDDIGFGG